MRYEHEELTFFETFAWFSRLKYSQNENKGKPQQKADELVRGKALGRMNGSGCRTAREAQLMRSLQVKEQIGKEQNDKTRTQQI